MVLVRREGSERDGMNDRQEQISVRYEGGIGRVRSFDPALNQRKTHGP